MYSYHDDVSLLVNKNLERVKQQIYPLIQQELATYKASIPQHDQDHEQKVQAAENAASCALKFMRHLESAAERFKQKSLATRSEHIDALIQGHVHTILTGVPDRAAQKQVLDYARNESGLVKREILTGMLAPYSDAVKQAALAIYDLGAQPFAKTAVPRAVTRIQTKYRPKSQASAVASSSSLFSGSSSSTDVAGTDEKMGVATRRRSATEAGMQPKPDPKKRKTQEEEDVYPESSQFDPS